MTISAISWVPKGAAKETPSRYNMSEEEFTRIQSQINEKLESSKADLMKVQEEEEVVSLSTNPKDKSTTAKDKKQAAAMSDHDAAIIKEFNLDNYDNDSDNEGEESMDTTVMDDTMMDSDGDGDEDFGMDSNGNYIDQQDKEGKMILPF
jgi:hypothetical protein